MNLFLDLEETVIDDWYSAKFLPHNIKIIREKIKQLEEHFDDKFEYIDIFSFAILEQKDLDRFDIYFKNDIEKIFKLPVRNILCFDKPFINTFLKQFNTSIKSNQRMQDVLTLNSKSQMFELFCKDNHKGERSILFDDVVEDEVKITYEQCFLNCDTIPTEIITIKI